MENNSTTVILEYMNYKKPNFSVKTIIIKYYSTNFNFIIFLLFVGKFTDE